MVVLRTGPTPTTLHRLPSAPSSSPHNRPLTQPVTTGENAVAGHTLPKGEGRLRLPKVESNVSLTFNSRLLTFDSGLLDSQTKSPWPRADRIARGPDTDWVWLLPVEYLSNRRLAPNCALPLTLSR